MHSELIVLTRAAEANNMYAMQRGAHPAPTRAALHHDVAHCQHACSGPAADKQPAPKRCQPLHSILQRAFAGAVAAALVTAAPPPAAAYNVHLRDVENPAMQAGVRAATEGRWSDAERFFRVRRAGEPRLQGLTGLEHRP